MIKLYLEARPFKTDSLMGGTFPATGPSSKNKTGHIDDGKEGL
jgi:hypothetical protein